MTGGADVVIDRTALAALLTSVDGPVAKDLARRAIRVEAAVKRSLKQPGKGRVYTKTNPKRTHRASAPGAPPATDLGRLAAAITFEVGVDAGGLHARVGSNVAYERALELGAPSRGLAPRPHLRPALTAAAGEDR